MSAEGKHTPGPWRADKEAAQWHGPRGVMALAIFKETRPGSSLPIAWVHPYLYFHNHEADARLIAAAPELAEALQAIRDRFSAGKGYHGPIDRDKPTGMTWEQAEAALQKAGMR